VGGAKGWDGPNTISRCVSKMREIIKHLSSLSDYFTDLRLHLRVPKRSMYDHFDTREGSILNRR